MVKKLYRITITPAQIKLIHTLKSRLKLSDDEYRELLSEHRAWSSKELSAKEANLVIDELKRRLQAAGGWTDHGKTRRRYEAMAGRDSMATPAQLRMIEAMWKEVSYMTTELGRKAALRRFVKRIAHVDALEFLSGQDVPKIIRALEAMKRKPKTSKHERRPARVQVS